MEFCLYYLCYHSKLLNDIFNQINKTNSNNTKLIEILLQVCLRVYQFSDVRRAPLKRPIASKLKSKSAFNFSPLIIVNYSYLSTPIISECIRKLPTTLSLLSCAPSPQYIVLWNFTFVASFPHFVHLPPFFVLSRS